MFHVLIGLLMAVGFAAEAREATFIVKDGMPCSEIVISEKPTRTTKMAAIELQAFICKISGAKLAIVTSPGTNAQAQIYVGRSSYTDRLGIKDDGLDDGAFRMKSGPDWIALIGRDDDFVPREPWTKVGGGPSEPDRLRVLAEWDKRTGSFYGNPWGILDRRYSSTLGLWAYDECGSLNAVYEFLRSLGARWYMAGELGEVIPKLSDIPMPEMDETVRPAFGLRCFFGMGDTFSSLNRDDIFWRLRLGLNASSRAMGPASSHAHGLNNVLNRTEMRAAHTEYYAMGSDGLRKTNANHACLSSEGLVREAARYARAAFDIYNVPSVSVMPEDGFDFCQCSLCKGKDTPERGRAGTYSDYVWGFVDRVAREAAKTHPDRTISCAAYGNYTLPPQKIEKLSPNVQVGIVHCRGWHYPNPTERGLELRLPDLRAAWLVKTGLPIMGYEHYPFTHRGTFLPVYFLHQIDAGIKAQKDNSRGEFIEIGVGPFETRGHGLHSPEFAHLNVYVTARLYWDPDLDLDKLLDEYFKLFYGPAAAPMRELVEYSEENWRSMSDEPEMIDPVFELLEEARAAAQPGTVYRARVEGLAGYLETLRQFRAQSAQPREGVPVVRGRSLRGEQVTLDGRLEEPAWDKYVLQYRTSNLKNPAGGAPGLKTAFDVFWRGEPIKGILFFGIVCGEPDPDHLKTNGAAGASAILDGDYVELLLETQGHSYYHLVASPDGKLVEFDRQGGKVNRDWKSGAEVAVNIGSNCWSAEFRVPVSGEDRLGDPLHEIAGRRPTADFPWFINVGRQRVRGDKIERWMWSPTGGDSIHNPLKFGKLYTR